MSTETDSLTKTSERLGKLATSFALPTAGKWRRQRVVIFLVVFVVATFLSAAGVHLVQAELNEERRARFALLASDRAATVQRSFDLSFELLLAILPFFRNADGVSRQEFLDFIEPGLDRHPEIYAFEYAPRVTEAQRGDFEARTRTAGTPDFEIKELDSDGNVVPATNRFEYFPVVYAGAELDGCADIYALGCVAYWMLTGEYVFASESLTDMLVAHIQTEPTPPSSVGELEIPEALEALVLECLRKDPKDRPQTATEIADRLAALLVQHPWTNQDAKNWWTLGGDALARTAI